MRGKLALLSVALVAACHADAPTARKQKTAQPWQWHLPTIPNFALYEGSFYTIVPSSEIANTLDGAMMEDGIEEQMNFQGGSFEQGHDFGETQNGTYTVRGQTVCIRYAKPSKIERCGFLLRRYRDHKLALTDFKHFRYGDGL